MLTDSDKKWLDHLSDTDKIKIIPFDPTSEEKFQVIKNKLKQALPEFDLLHKGASSFGISGQDEIDTYLPVPENLFNDYVEKLSKILGPYKSFYANDRVHFINDELGKRIDIYLMNEDGPSWKKNTAIDSYLRSHPEALEEYRILKEMGNGLSVREYYTRKTDFFNQILAKK